MDKDQFRQMMKALKAIHGALQLRSIVPGADARTIECGAISAGPSVPGDSLRKIRELCDEITFCINKDYRLSAKTHLETIREICSHENRA